MNSVILAFIILAILISVLALRKSKQNKFYTNTFVLNPLGIFVWGDGLVLGPFWAVSGIVWWLLQLDIEWIIKYVLVFWMIRSAYEVVYWIAHQSTDADYTPPTPPFLQHLDRNEIRILYQLWHMGVVIVSLFLFVYL